MVNVHRAKTELSRLLEAVEQGEDVVIARAGVPVARLVPVRPHQRVPGRLSGMIRIREDFDAPLPAPLANGFGSHAAASLPPDSRLRPGGIPE
jgi:prevent-host-death family protein